ncbi:MAG: hypothetical protein HKN35_15840 [Woeseia sp.]|nr:hypothetical protein [Woeseia sp.]
MRWNPGGTKEGCCNCGGGGCFPKRHYPLTNAAGTAFNTTEWSVGSTGNVTVNGYDDITVTNDTLTPVTKPITEAYQIWFQLHHDAETVECKCTKTPAENSNTFNISGGTMTLESTAHNFVPLIQGFGLFANNFYACNTVFSPTYLVGEIGAADCGEAWGSSYDTLNTYIGYRNKRGPFHTWAEDVSFVDFDENWELIFSGGASRITGVYHIPNTVEVSGGVIVEECPRRRVFEMYPYSSRFAENLDVPITPSITSGYDIALEGAFTQRRWKGGSPLTTPINPIDHCQPHPSDSVTIPWDYEPSSLLNQHDPDLITYRVGGYEISPGGDWFHSLVPDSMEVGLLMRMGKIAPTVATAYPLDQCFATLFLGDIGTREIASTALQRQGTSIETGFTMNLTLDRLIAPRDGVSTAISLTYP